MREILFRGKRTDNHQWVEGFFIMDDLENPNPYIVNRWKHRVSHKTLGQYTGLTDKNGKKIFEGDIVQYYGTYALEVLIKDGHAVIRWFDKVSNRRYTELFFGYDEEAYGECEVIGNIHDNPELLEESNES